MSRALSLRVALVGVIAASAVVTPGPAHALFHLMKVTEVFGGTSAQPAAQFIELQMFADNQRFLASHEVVVFDAAGAEVGAFAFTAPVENGASQAHVLIASPEAVTVFGVPADLEMDPVIARGGGKACFRSNSGELIDCASWGSFSGDNAGSGAPFNAPVGLVADQSMSRDISGGSDPDGLDADDDTNDSAADFDLEAPTPTNNAGQSPDLEQHERSVTLSIRKRSKLVASGKVSSADGYQPCEADVPVRVQRRSEGRWRTIKGTVTRSEGTYRTTLPNRRGRYRTRAMPVVPEEGHECLAAFSPVRRR